MQTTLVIAVTIDDSSLGFPVDVRDMAMNRIRPALATLANEADAVLDMHWDVVGVMTGVDSSHVMAVDRRAVVTTA